METNKFENTYFDLLKNAKENRKTIQNFIKKNKNSKKNNLDNEVHFLHNKFSNEIDCLKCANCCKSLGPRISEVDIQRISKKIKLKPSEFYKLYLKTDEEGDYVFKQMPCPFLMSDNCCQIYENRPIACREYPHTDRKNFHQILDLSAKNAEICPIVYKVFEKLTNK